MWGFTLPYDPAAVQPNGQVTLAARVLVNGQLSYLTTQSYPAITGGNPTEGFTLDLQTVDR